MLGRQRGAVIGIVAFTIPLLLTAAPAADAPDRTLEVTAIDGGGDTGDYWFRFQGLNAPNPTVTFTAGETVTVRVVNEGSQPHNLRFGPPIAEGVRYLAPGEADTMTFTVPAEPGNGTYWCDPHRQLGMRGEFVIHETPQEAGEQDRTDALAPLGVLLCLGTAAHLHRRRNR